jgi:hypothetical protein
MTEPALDTTYTTSNMDTSGGVSAPGLIVGAILLIWSVAASWKVYEKAHQPGWAALIPIYNIYIMLKIAGRPGWWLVLYLIPLVNIVAHIMVSIDIAKAFGKSTAFGVIGIWLFGLIGLSIIGFGSATYKGAPQH